MKEIKWMISLEEIFKNIRRNKLVMLILIFQCVIAFTLTAVTSFNFMEAKDQSADLENSTEGKQIYTLKDKVDETNSFDSYIGSNEEYEKLKNFVSSMTNAENLKFLVMSSKSIELPKKEVKKKLRIEEVVADRSNENAEVKTVHFSEKTFEEFKLELKSGEPFKESDYTFNNQRVPIILGKEYKGKLNLNDKVEGRYYFENVIFEVVGFLEDENFVLKDGEVRYLDEYAIVPAFKEIDVNSYNETAKIALLDYSNGEIVTDNQDIDIQNEVNKKVDESGSMGFYVNPMNRKKIETNIMVTSELAERLFRIMASVIIFTMIGLSASISSRIKDDYYRYGVHLMNGARLFDITVQIVGILIFIIGIGSIGSLILSLILTGVGQHILISLLIALLMLIISAIYPYIVIKNISISSLVRRND